jgi:hypothetical protein
MFRARERLGVSFYGQGRVGLAQGTHCFGGLGNRARIRASGWLGRG